MEKTYVLVHGAWLGGWCWDLVKPIIEAEGHRVIAVDLPGHGGSSEPIEKQNMETYTQYLVSVIREQVQPVILVGHSMGGMVISQAASRAPEKVEKLVYITAFLPKDGQSNDGLENGIKPTPWRDMAKQGIAVTMDETETISQLIPEAAMELLYNDVEPERAREYVIRLGRENINAQYQAVSLGREFDAIDKFYVRCSLDTISVPELQDKMLAETPCKAVYTIESGHSPYHSKPEELAAVLLGLAV